MDTDLKLRKFHIEILLIACSFTHITFPKLVFCVISVVIIH